MKTVEIMSLPQIRFAHIYHADSYTNTKEASDNTIEVTYIFDGKLEFTVNNKKVVARKGDVICNLSDTDVVISALSFHCHHTVGVSTQWAFCDNPIQGLNLPFITRACDDLEPIHRMIDELIYKPDRYQDSTTRGAHMFLNILMKLDECNRNSIDFRIPGEILLAEKAKKYILRNLKTPLTHTEIAQVLDISSGYLCRIFKRTQGMSLMQYINQTKLKAIANLMERENLKLYEASALYGYSDANYVSRLYKKTFGYNITEKPTRALHP